MKFAVVEWEDAWSSDGQEKIEDIKDGPLIMISGGLLVRYTKKGITLARDYVDASDNNWRDPHWISRKMIKSVKIFEK